jgi:hypothetical protein
MTGRPLLHDKEEIGKRLIVWAEKETSLNLNAFCAENRICPSDIFLFSQKCESFSKAVKFAKACIAVRREHNLNTGKLHNSAYGMNAPVYDLFLKEERREQARFEAEMKNNNAQPTVNLSDLLDLAKKGVVSE